MKKYVARLTLENNYKIRIHSNHHDYVADLKDEFAIHVKNYYFMGKYKAGMWDGKTHFITEASLMPYGLLPIFLQTSKKMFPDVKIEADEGVKNLFKGPYIDFVYDLSLYPRPYQKDCIETCIKYTKGIIQSATACHAKGDKIILHTGETKNIEDVKIGDYVIGKDGNPKKVLNTFNGIDDLYEINPKNKKTSITVTKNHLLHLGFTNRGGKYDKRKNTFENISVEDYLNKSNWYKHISKLSYFNKEINFEHKKINCDLSPYFIGLYLGDGGKHTCNITTADDEIINEINKEANRFNMKVETDDHHKYMYKIKGSKNKRNLIFNEFEKIGIMFGRKNMISCKDRFIPQIIFNQNIEYRKEVLAGLIDSDGCLTNETYYEFTSKSKKLRNDVELLSISLGLCCSKSERIINGVPYYRVCIMGNIDKIPVKIKRKKPKRKSKTNAYRSAFNVKYIGRNNFYGIEVEDSLYLTENGMITHNSGKSLVISYIIKNLFIHRKKTGVRKCLIIVPSKGLVEQFKADMIEYGLPENLIGRVYDGPKEWDRHIVISTWQTLKNNYQKLKEYHCVMVDETHKAKAHELKKILSKCQCRYRFGFTGTTPPHVNDMYNVQSFIGPVLRTYSSGFLAEEGYISKCNVKRISLSYPDGTNASNYKGIKDECFSNQRRLTLIGDIVKNIDDNVLLLVSYLHEGETLKKLINRRTDKEVVFLSGKDKVDVREEWRQKIIKGKNIALIATYGIFEAGINIPNLKYLILASPTKAKIRTMQSIGRVLRLHKSKKDGAFVYDIIDQVKYLSKHAEKRKEYYESDGFNIEDIEFNPFISIEEFIV